MDHRIVNVRTDVNACVCTRVCTDTRKRVRAESWLGQKSLAAAGNRTCVSSVPVRRSTSWATSPPCCCALSSVCLNTSKDSRPVVWLSFEYIQATVRRQTECTIYFSCVVVFSCFVLDNVPILPFSFVSFWIFFGRCHARISLVKRSFSFPCLFNCRNVSKNEQKQSSRTEFPSGVHRSSCSRMSY